MTTSTAIEPPDCARPQGLNMIRADIDLQSFYRWAGSRGIISPSGFDAGFAMHCLLAEVFGEVAPKPYRVIIPRDRGRKFGVLYGYARSCAEELCSAMSVYADPLQSTIIPVSSIAGKSMPAFWQSGQTLGFEILIRPTVRNARGSRNAGKERDAFLAEIERCQEKQVRHSREEIYSNWLSTKIAMRGARLMNPAKLRSFRRVNVIRKLATRPSAGPDAVMHGTIEVIVPEQFANLLARGLGRHRAYGYGMLLLRPPVRSTNV